MIRAKKVRLYSTEEQEQNRWQSVGITRFIYNWTLPILLLLSLFLTGCNSDAGLMSYKILYASGNELSSETDTRTLLPIEQSDMQLYTEHITGSEYILHIQDKDQKDLYTYSNAKSFNRGQIADETLWICAEQWTSVHSGQFLDSTLKNGTIVQFNIANGEILFHKELEKNEFLITIQAGKCYFYSRGSKDRNAALYCRDIADWDKRLTIFTFDYQERPTEVEKDPNGGGNYTLQFELQENAFTVSLTDYRKNNSGLWEHTPLWCEVIPYDGT